MTDRPHFREGFFLHTSCHHPGKVTTEKSPANAGLLLSVPLPNEVFIRLRRWRRPVAWKAKQDRNTLAPLDRQSARIGWLLDRR
jgi:hypothetical protein